MNDDFCSVAICLYGESLSVDGASRLLGLTPTRFRNRGDVRVTSSGSEVIQKIGFWEYRTSSSAKQITSSLAGIVSQIGCARVVGEAGIEKAELDVFVPLDAEDEQGGFSMGLSSDLLGKLSRLGFDVIVTSR